MTEGLWRIRAEAEKQNNLIHCITNPISINKCANAVLAVGARPIMAEHPKETAEITQNAKALLLNLGNITDVRIKSMSVSARCAKKNNIPIVLDPAGVACSFLRRNFALKLIKKYSPAVIKGNYSEIYSLYNSSYRCDGVDSEELAVNKISDIAAKAARKYKCIIIASGKTDIVTDGNSLIHIKNGAPALAKITGTGCMLGALCACFLPSGNALKAAVCACAVLGICGELAENEKGNGTFEVSLIDKLSVMTYADFEKYLKTEEFKIESI